MRKNSVRRVRTVAVLAAAMMLLSALPVFANESNAEQQPEQAAFNADAFGGDNVAEGKLLVTTAAAGDTAWTSAVPNDAATTQVASRVHSVKVPAGTEAEVGAEIAAQDGVEAVEPVRIAQTQETPNDEFYEDQWAHQQANAEAGWDLSTGSSDVSVVIADTGVDAGHPDIADRITAQYKS